MTEINDEFLLKQLLDFCDNIKDEEGLAEFSKADNFFHPLDREVKHQIDVLMKKGTTKRERDKMTMEERLQEAGILRFFLYLSAYGTPADEGKLPADF